MCGDAPDIDFHPEKTHKERWERWRETEKITENLSILFKHGTVVGFQFLYLFFRSFGMFWVFFPRAHRSSTFDIGRIKSEIWTHLSCYDRVKEILNATRVSISNERRFFSPVKKREWKKFSCFQIPLLSAFFTKTWQPTKYVCLPIPTMHATRTAWCTFLRKFAPLSKGVNKCQCVIIDVGLLVEQIQRKNHNRTPSVTIPIF